MSYDPSAEQQRQQHYKQVEAISNDLASFVVKIIVYLFVGTLACSVYLYALIFKKPIGNNHRFGLILLFIASWVMYYAVGYWHPPFKFIYVSGIILSSIHFLAWHRYFRLRSYVGESDFYDYEFFYKIFDFFSFTINWSLASKEFIVNILQFLFFNLFLSFVVYQYDTWLGHFLRIGSVFTFGVWIYNFVSWQMKVSKTISDELEAEDFAHIVEKNRHERERIKHDSASLNAPPQNDFYNVD